MLWGCPSRPLLPHTTQPHHTCGAVLRLRDMRENKDLLSACYPGKAPSGISEPLNSTACCKWDCLLCSVGAGYSQLSLLTQRHNSSPSHRPTPLHSLCPVLFPLKLQDMWSPSTFLLSIFRSSKIPAVAGRHIPKDGTRLSTAFVQEAAWDQPVLHLNLSTSTTKPWGSS